MLCRGSNIRVKVIGRCRDQYRCFACLYLNYGYMYYVVTVIARLVAEWKAKKDAVARGEIPKSDEKNADDEDIYHVTEHDVSLLSFLLHIKQC